VRDIQPPSSKAITLPERFDRLGPFQRALLENELEDMASTFGPCLICRETETSSCGVAVYPPPTAVKLGAPPDQWVALAYRLCAGCQAVADNAQIDAAIFEHRQQKGAS
jgi:hypothetical protein